MGIEDTSLTARIEQLEAALREIKDQYLSPNQSSAIAKAALQPNIEERLERVDASLAAQLGKSIELNARITARCEVMAKALRPFADIALCQDFDSAAADMIDMPDFAIVPNDVRTARMALPQSAGEARSPGDGK